MLDTFSLHKTLQGENIPLQAHVENGPDSLEREGVHAVVLGMRWPSQ